jgi:predicted short-subunit dehydrogenase-like oxidoreductase (DUF2520 family)
MNKMPKIGFIGAGTVAKTLSVALSQKGYPVVAVSSRYGKSAAELARLIEGCRTGDNNQQVADEAELIFIATPDDVIAAAADEVEWRAGQSVVHLSGADSTDILAPAEKYGASTGCIHPLQTFAGSKQKNLPAITYAIEAAEPLLATLKRMAADLGGYFIEIKAEDKVLYHAAAVFVCNYLVTLVKTATDLWQGFDIPQEKAIPALLPLLRGTIDNIETSGIPQCLTGPIARGDSGTIKKHIKALQAASPDLLPLYRELGLKTIPVAIAKGIIDDKQANELEAVLKEGR